MATYVVGDIHGCLEAFGRLLEALRFDPGEDQLYHTGDLVNGGEDSAGVLRWFMEHQGCADSVLGNHDLHLLAVWRGRRKVRLKDTFRDVFEAPDSEALLEWLRQRPMMVDLGQGRVLVHAGLLPVWTVEEAFGAAREIEAMLREKPEKLLKGMYGNEPRRWKKALTRKKRHRVIINAMTRMRVLSRRGKLEFKYTGTYKKIPKNRRAWFDMPEVAWEGVQVHCGHWSALGLHQTDRVLSLDTGCRWGRKLTAVCLETGEITSVDGRALTG